MKIISLAVIFYCIIGVTAKHELGNYSGNYIKNLKAEGRYTRNIKDYEIVIPHKVNEDSTFLSYYLPHFHDCDYYEEIKKWHNSDSDRKKDDDLHKVHYKVEVAGKHRHLELVPNFKLTPQSLILEKRAADGIKNISKLNIHQIGPKNKCHFIGTVRGEQNSQAAISLCNGLAGFIKTNDGSYLIEPLKNEEASKTGKQLHIIYKRSSNSLRYEAGSCGTSDDWEKAWEERLVKEALSNSSHRSYSFIKRSLSKKNTLETLVVADKRFLDYHNGTDIETYILTIMNMASEYFHDASIGNDVDVSIVRIIYLEKEEEEIDLFISQDSSKTLKSFCKWQVGITPKVGHPNHHDIAVLLTRYNLCGDGSCELLGLAYVATACEPNKACSINEDNGLILGVTVAHEIGHIMGCSHDETETNGCTPQSNDGFNHVMSPFVHLSTNVWSKCSKKFITDFLDLNLGTCLANEPSEHGFKGSELLPGAVYDADTQCVMAFGQNTSVCQIDQSKFCEILFCKTSPQSCSSINEPPADGTSCGSNKWCYKKKCVQMGVRPNAVNGGWGRWGTESKCSRTCGGGVSVSERQCDNPKPSNRGRYCLGPRKRYAICNIQVSI